VKVEEAAHRSVAVLLDMQRAQWEPKQRKSGCAKVKKFIPWTRQKK
jgi:hypothetical protein